jgi:hypothetical protein
MDISSTFIAATTLYHQDRNTPQTPLFSPNPLNKMSIPRRKGGSISQPPTNILLPAMADFSGLSIGSPSPGLITPGIGAHQAGMVSNVSLSGTTMVDIQMGPT